MIRELSAINGKTMNKAYELLKQLSMKELEKYLDQIQIDYRFIMTPAGQLIEHQVQETMRRKSLGIW